VVFPTMMGARSVTVAAFLSGSLNYDELGRWIRVGYERGYEITHGGAVKPR